MSAHAPRRFTRRTLLKGSSAAVPIVATTAGRCPALGWRASPTTTVAAQNLPALEMVAGNTAFAFGAFAALRQTTDGNLLFSPYSISQALAMAYAGAHGETAAQMAEALAFRLPDPELHEAFSTLNADLVARGNNKADPEPAQQARSLRVANALWVDQSYPFRPSYTAKIERYYGAELHQADFRRAPEETREEINAWVEEQTEDRIQNVLGTDDITATTVAVLVNAIYFYGAWRTAFAPEDTHDDTFHRLDGTTVTVPMMYQVADLPYAWGDGYEMLELPYADSGFALTVILPDEGQFDAVEAALDAQTLDAAIGQLAEAEVHVYLPRFELEFGPIKLNDTLQALGMVDAFDPDRADFTGIADRGLVIQKVLHKAHIGVDEKGTEAAAATAVSFGSPTARPWVDVRIDRPFLFAIRDTRTGTLLFLGRVTDPSGETPA